MRKCNRCGRHLDLEDYPKNKTCKDGHAGVCKRCKYIARREKFGFKHAVCMLEKSCRICLEIKSLSVFCEKKNTFDGRDTRCNKCRYEYRDKEKAHKRQKEYIARKKLDKKYVDQVREKDRIRAKERRKDPVVRIGKRVSEMMRRALNGTKANKSTWDIVDYSPEELKIHLEKQFTVNMTWERFLSGDIHIDHIIPQSSFNFSSFNDKEFKDCWNISNLQPLWAKDNISKSNKMMHLI